jgi:hypothetical protein
VSNREHENRYIRPPKAGRTSQIAHLYTYEPTDCEYIITFQIVFRFSSLRPAPRQKFVVPISAASPTLRVGMSTPVNLTRATIPYRFRSCGFDNDDGVLIQSHPSSILCFFTVATPMRYNITVQDFTIKRSTHDIDTSIMFLETLSLSSLSLSLSLSHSLGASCFTPSSQTESPQSPSKRWKLRSPTPSRRRFHHYRSRRRWHYLNREKANFSESRRVSVKVWYSIV